MFSGLLVCADCGHNLHFHFNQGNPDIKYFNCSNYKGNRGTCTSTHYVRVDFLEQVVLGEIRRLTKFASQFEDEFVKAVIGHSQQAEATDRKLKEKELKALQARDEELDGLFERIYEDNVSGKLSDDRFARMSRRYEEEQKELAEKIKALRAEIDKQNSQSMTTDMFISLVRKYTRARKLTPRMLNELIEKIEVFNAEKVDGVWEQRLRIHYNCVGTIEIPDLISLPAPEVSVNTRKGVVVNYAPSVSKKWLKPLSACQKRSHHAAFSDILKSGDEDAKERSGAATGSRNAVHRYVGTQRTLAAEDRRCGKFRTYLRIGRRFIL